MYYKIMTGLYLNAKPFLKWAGGKTQLINELSKRIPKKFLKNKIIDRYVEPFVGGGAFFFYLKNNFLVKESFLIDNNKELIIVYKTIQNDIEELIKKLKNLEKIFLKSNVNQQKKMFYKIREDFNIQKKSFDYQNYNSDWIDRSAFMIFLNKTCYNGLFRLNKKGEFNVPFGKYKNPKICDDVNLRIVNKALKDTEIYCFDFYNAKDFIEKETFVYLDPPYRPLNKTSNFTAYTDNGFNEKDQKRLAKFFKEMDTKGAYLLLSNSDPKNIDANDNFFENLYKEYIIERVSAKRFINCKSHGRGEINELIIRNYSILGD